MAALPYMQLYVADYLADTTHLTAAQHGAYMLLLMNYWTRGEALRASDERLANVARMSREEWAENRDVLAEFFVVTPDTWSHRRVERDLAAVLSKCDKARASGIASANPRRNARTNERSTDVITNVPTDGVTDGQRNGNHRDKTRGEETRQETDSALTFNADMVAQGVMHELGLGGMRLRLAIEEVARSELKKGADGIALVDQMVKAWREYQARKPDLEYAKGAEKFFGEGDWRDHKGWPWKEGKGPKVAVKFLNG